MNDRWKKLLIPMLAHLFPFSSVSLPFFSLS
jgi:hypothetical protein